MGDTRTTGGDTHANRDITVTRDDLDRLDAAWQTRRDLWRRGANGITLDDVCRALDAYLSAFHATQRERWGRVRVRLKPGKLFSSYRPAGRPEP